MNQVSFHGGGGSAPKTTTPVSTPDTLAATDQIEVMLAIGVGPIKGLTKGLKSFFIGTTQYQNDDGSFNFDLFNVEVYPGNTPGEVITPTLGGFEDYRVGVQELEYNKAVSFTTTAADCSQIIVRILVRSLHAPGTDAQLAPIVGVTNAFNPFLPKVMQVGIRYRTIGGDYKEPFTKPFEIVGKTISGEWHEIRFATTVPGPHEVEITSLTENITDAPCLAQLEGHYEVTGGAFGTSRSTNVGVTLASGVPVVRNTDFPNPRKDGTFGVDYLCVRFAVQTLYRQDTTGTYTDFIKVLIEFKASSSSTWNTVFDGPVTINGKTSKVFPTDYRWKVAPVNDTYDIRVTRITLDEPNHFRVIVWDALLEIVGGPVQYDGIAIAHLNGTASNQFTSIPDFWGIYDLKIVRVPNNYNPYTREYTGAWDGTFKLEWTNNPAWCLYDLAMSEEYGLRRYWRVFHLDKWDCYKAGQWCDGLVPNGKGGSQPRYTFNGLISEPRGAMEQLRYMAGVFNGGFLDDGNGVTRLVFDHEEPACAVFTPENIVSDGFSYSYTDITTRKNEITCKFNNPDLNYQPDQRTKIDTDHVARYGSNPEEFAAIGCTDAHEAYRRATYKLLTSTTEKELVSFATNRQGLMIRPFSVILISDPVMGYGITGRIKELDQYRQTIYLRDAIFLELGVEYIFRTHCANPDYPENSVQPLTTVERAFYAPLQGQLKAFELSAPLPAGVYENAQFSIGTPGNEIGVPKPYRVTTIEEMDGNPDNISIQGIEINRAKWLLSDNVADGQYLDYLIFPEDLPPPTALKITTDKIDINGAKMANVSMVWKAPLDARVNSYECQYKLSTEVPWRDLNATVRERMDIYNIPDDVYDFRVRSAASHGKRSLWATVQNIPAGLNVPPDDVSALSLSVVGDNLLLEWIGVKAVDLSYYWVKFSPLIGSEATWESSVTISAQVKALHLTTIAQAGTYFVKAVNTSGVEGLHAASATTETQNLTHTEIYRKNEHPTWTGLKTHSYVNGVILRVEEGYLGPGQYQWAGPDLGSILTCRVNLEIVGGGDLEDNFISKWQRLSDVKTLSGSEPQDYLIEVFISWSKDMIIWTDWAVFRPGDFLCRQVRFFINVTAKRAAVRPLLKKLTTVLTVPARTETGRNVFIPTQGQIIVFPQPFKVLPAFTVTMKTPSSGDYATITDESTFGFTINLYNGSGQPIGSSVDWQAVGFGGK